MGTSGSQRAVRLRSLASSGVTRFDGPSETRTTPGRPTTRDTMSWLLLTATAGVTTRLLPRIDWMTAAAAPGWPSIWRYAARIARRLNQYTATRNH